MALAAVAGGVAHAAQATWTLSTELVPAERPEQRAAQDASLRTVLVWRKGTQQRRYAPPAPPFGLVDAQRVRLDGRDLFLTSWAHGARSVVLRVFEPERRDTPLCEAVSFAEAGALRLRKSTLEVAVVDDGGRRRWQACRP